MVEGDVLNTGRLEEAIAAPDVVYANLAAEGERLAKNVVSAMRATGVLRLVWISSMGIYDTGDDLAIRREHARRHDA